MESLSIEKKRERYRLNRDLKNLESSTNRYVSRLSRIFFFLDNISSLITRSPFLFIWYSRRYDSRGCISDVNYL